METLQYDELMPILNYLATVGFYEEVVDCAIAELGASIDNGLWEWLQLVAMTKHLDSYSQIVHYGGFYFNL